VRKERHGADRQDASPAIQIEKSNLMPATKFTGGAEKLNPIRLQKLCAQV
jgi:hypothetical protein